MNPRPVTGTVILAAAALLGLASEAASFGWEQPKLWLPDLLTGWALIIMGLLSWTRTAARGAAVLMGATGVAWFLAAASPDLMVAHRGPLFHLLITYPGWRPRNRLTAFAVLAGYSAALTPGVWASDQSTVALSVGLLLLVARPASRATSPPRRQRWPVVAAAALVAAALAGGALARMLQGGSTATAVPALFAYEAALVGAMWLLHVHLPRRPSAHLTDLVVELGDTPSAALRDRLAEALGDPGLELGLWSRAEGHYLADDGRPVSHHDPGQGRVVTTVTQADRPYAAIVHDEQALTTGPLSVAVARAVRLGDANASLRDHLDEQYHQIYASRQRILVAADEELRRLHLRLTIGPDRHLTELGDVLDHLAADATDGPLARACLHVREIRVDLNRLSQGLAPIDLLRGGLGQAVADLAARSPCRVDVQVDSQVATPRLPPTIETTAYFVCAEALTNVAKHANASHVDLGVALVGDTLTVAVTDDGAGGADPAAGTGLQRLGDRVAAIGGQLEVVGPLGRGTTVRAVIPVAERSP
jgi:hypothetical protein